MEGKKKVFWFDTETTGTDPAKHGIIQLAALIEIDGREEEELILEIQPDSSCEISDEALSVNGYNREEIKDHASEWDAFSTLVSAFDRYIDKYDPADKFWIGGYNVDFDMGFLQALWNRAANTKERRYLGSYLRRSHVIDAYHLARVLTFTDHLRTKNLKLGTVADAFRIHPGEDGLHDALVDVRLTRDLFYEMVGTSFGIKERK